MATVHIELHGIQRFIFRSQRLRSMLGGDKLIRRWLAGAKDIATEHGWEVTECAGGHFEAVGDTPPDALIALLIEHLREIAPGLTASINIDGMASGSVRHADLLAQPYLQPCAEFGSIPAARTLRTTGRDVHVSRAFESRHEISSSESDQVEELSDLSDQGYIALVKLDGNSFGPLAIRAAEAGAFSLAEVYRDLRDVREHVLRQAISEACSRPHRTLMNAGDDLLIAMRPRDALAFVDAFARQWSQYPHQHQHTRSATFAAGVVIAHHKLPILRLDQLAEELCASAKRRSRTSFAVDWIVCTQSWMDDLLTQRRRDCMVRYRIDGCMTTFLLSEKPLLVRRPEGKPDGPPWSLEELLQLERKLDGAASPARSQWRAFLDELRRGRMQGEIAYRKLLNRAALDGLPSNATRVLPSPDARSKLYATALGDLVELHEIGLMGKGRPDTEELE